jgi:hypothetical protein
MWQFLISGYVPGTDFQITFDTIAGLACILFLTAVLKYELHRTKTLQRQILATSEAVQDFRRSFVA